MRRILAAALGLACLLAGCGADHTPIGGTPCRVSDTDPRRWDLTGRMFAETDEAYLFYDGAIEDDALRDALWECIASAEDGEPIVDDGRMMETSWGLELNDPKTGDRLIVSFGVWYPEAYYLWKLCDEEEDDAPDWRSRYCFSVCAPEQGEHAWWELDYAADTEAAKAFQTLLLQGIEDEANLRYTQPRVPPAPSEGSSAS